MENRFTCRRCKVEKIADDFFVSRKRKTGFTPWCKDCFRAYRKSRAEDLRIWSQNYYKKNKEKINKSNKLYRKIPANKRRLQLQVNIKYGSSDVFRKSRLDAKHKYREKEATKQKELEYKKEYLSKPEVVEHVRRVKRLKWLNNPQYKLSNILRSRLKKAINNDQKVGSAVRDLGCTIQFLKEYIESKFVDGMNWGNWGLYGWHIDHIIPLCRFDLTDREQFLKATHYTNLQPLWAKDNLRKQK